MENDIPGASLLGRKPEELKTSELRFWLKCHRDVGKGLKTKAELVKRVRDYIQTDKDKHVVDPDLHKIYSRRKEKQGMNSEPDTDSNESVRFPSSGSGTSLEKKSENCPTYLVRRSGECFMFMCGRKSWIL